MVTSVDGSYLKASSQTSRNASRSRFELAENECLTSCENPRTAFD